MISKELLSDVLNNHNIEHFEIENNYLWLQTDGGYLNKNISIYELAHKCKEWALGKDFVLYSGSTHRTKGYRCDIYTKDGDVDEDFVSDTEPKAIFKACEWIREQIAS